MAFANWKSKKLQAAIVAISAIDEVITPVFSPTIATIATIADVESSKQLAANDQEAQEEADWNEFLYGKSTEELLYNHLLTCPLCHVKAKQYCLYGAELGKQYDALLLNSEHAQERRTALVMQVDRANITGNKRYIPFQPAPF